MTNETLKKIPDYPEVLAMYERGEPDGWEPVDGEEAFRKLFTRDELLAAGWELPSKKSDNELWEWKARKDEPPRMRIDNIRFEILRKAPDSREVETTEEFSPDVRPEFIIGEYLESLQLRNKIHIKPPKALMQAVTVLIEPTINAFSDIAAGLNKRFVKSIAESEWFEQMRKEGEEIDLFLAAIKVKEDDPILDDASWKGLLEDARTVKQTLTKYDKKAYIPPSSSPPRGPVSSYIDYALMVARDEMSEKEVQELCARETYHTASETYSDRDIGYDNLYPEEKKRELGRCRKGIKRAREGLRR